jgi:dTDP-4-amino-4,6-dideoxygalactose transaminase
LYAELKQSRDLATEQVYQSGRHLLGNCTKELENRIAKLSQAKHCVMLGSGSDALYYGLVASGLSKSLIAFPAQTFIATKNSINRSNNTPVPVDVTDTGLLDWNKIPSGIDHVIWVGLFGNNYQHLPENKKIYEDGAQHFGAPLQGIFASYSFDPTKSLPNFGNAGAVVTNSDTIAGNLRSLRRHGLEIGGNSIPSERECAELLVKLDHFPIWQERRQEIARDYYQQIGHLVTCVTDPRGQVSKFVISTPLRVELEMWMIKREIQIKRVYEQPIYKSPQATENCLCQLALPCDPYMTDHELYHVILAIKEFFEEFPFKGGL